MIIIKMKHDDLPFWMLLVRFASVVHWLCPELDETIVQFPMCPVELWIRSITKSERGKFHLRQTPRSQSSTSKRSPKGLAVGGQFTLASGGNGNEHNFMLQ